jgi:hypothetical protein
MRRQRRLRRLRSLRPRLMGSGCYHTLTGNGRAHLSPRDGGAGHAGSSRVWPDFRTRNGWPGHHWPSGRFRGNGGRGRRRGYHDPRLLPRLGNDPARRRGRRRRSTLLALTTQGWTTQIGAGLHW